MSSSIAIQVIRNYTVEPIGNAIQEIASSLDLHLDIAYGTYGNSCAELLDFKPADASIVFLSLDLDYFAGGIHSPLWDYDATVAEFESILAAIDQMPPEVFIIVSNFIPTSRIKLPLAPNHPILGRDRVAAELNHRLISHVSRYGGRMALLDFERISSKIGRSNSIDRRFALMAKSPFTNAFIECASREFARLLKCRVSPPKKVLVMDCDNTLWGGIVGEDGPDNIQLDPYEYPGIAYHRLQFEILELVEKGVLLCLNSKNDESSVFEVLDQHPQCLIHRRHLAAFRINWNDKSTNLREIASELNLSLDSMVFVDDNPVECELVRTQIPEVTVIQIPAKAYEIPGIFDGLDLFDRLTLSEDDKARLNHYQSERIRKEHREQYSDAAGFLESLNMKACVSSARAGDIDRASQLCMRTNQFNLTTIRHTSSDLLSMLNSPNYLILLLNASDRFGQMGTTGMAILQDSGSEIIIESFILSCRIIGRGYDRVMFTEGIKAAAQKWGHRRIRATYKPTAKNSIVANYWKELGFTLESSGEIAAFSTHLDELNTESANHIETEIRI